LKRGSHSDVAASHYDVSTGQYRGVETESTVAFWRKNLQPFQKVYNYLMIECWQFANKAMSKKAGLKA